MVEHRQTPADHGVPGQRRILDRTIAESASTLVGKELSPLRVGCPPRRKPGDGRGLASRGTRHESIGDDDVRGAIVVEIGGDGSEAGAAPALALETRRPDGVAKESGLILQEQGMELLGQMRDEDIAPGVAIEISEGRAHVGCGAPHGVESKSTHRRFLGESSIASIDEQSIGPAVVRTENVGPPVARKVRTDQSQGDPEGTCQSGGFSDVLKLRRRARLGCDVAE